MLEKRLFRVPRTARRSNQCIIKEISPEYSLEGLMLVTRVYVPWSQPLGLRQREESGGARGGEREAGGGGRERKSACTQERKREKALWLLLLYVFSSTWACPMQIGLIQECCLFYLKSSLWSADLPCFYLATAILDSFSLFYLTFPPQEMGGPIFWE